MMTRDNGLCDMEFVIETI